MIKLFRKFRQNLLIENKAGKYFKYAIGEIVLVVIGILIALQINNWNENNTQKGKLSDDYNSILKELNYVNSVIYLQNERNKSTITRTRKSLQILKLKNVDSILKLETNLSGLVRLNRLQFELPVTLAFIENTNLEKVKNIKLKTLLHKLKSELSFLKILQNYATTQYQNLIEPYVVNNLNFADLKTQDYTINTGIKSDYKVLMNDLKLANILNLKLETDITASEELEKLIKTIEQLKNEISNELN